MYDHTDPKTMYFRELQRYPRRLPANVEDALVARARRGDAEAKQRLIESSLYYVAKVAASHQRKYRAWLRHDDYMDIVAVGNLALVMHLEQALQVEGRPCAYLNATAKRAIWLYCVLHSPMVTVPERMVREKKHDEPYFTESLDAQLEGTELTYLDIVAVAAELDDELDERHQPNYEALYQRLPEALDALSDKQREVVVRHYGLDGKEPESLYAINMSLFGKESSLALQRLQRALIKIREKMFPYADEILPQGQEEEQEE